MYSVTALAPIGRAVLEKAEQVTGSNPVCST